MSIPDLQGRANRQSSPLHWNFLTSVVQLVIRKLKVPIVWLDTSVIVRMAQLWSGAKVPRSEEARTKKLYEAIRAKTMEKKLVCPHADHAEEIWCDRRQFLRFMLHLSLGAKAKYSERLKNLQICQMMHAYSCGEKEFVVDYKDFFTEDPLARLENPLEFGVHVDLTDPEFGKTTGDRRTRQKEKLETKRQRIVAKGIDFDTQLMHEYNVDIQNISDMIRRHNAGALDDPNTLALANLLATYFKCWRDAGGAPGSLRGFFASSHYRSVPFVRIECQLAASIMTSTEPIQSGHMMDLRHAASAMPYVDLFVTDRQMKHTITKRRLDADYETTVCSVGDESIIDQFVLSL